MYFQKMWEFYRAECHEGDNVEEFIQTLVKLRHQINTHGKLQHTPESLYPITNRILKGIKKHILKEDLKAVHFEISQLALWISDASFLSTILSAVPEHIYNFLEFTPDQSLQGIIEKLHIYAGNSKARAQGTEGNSSIQQQQPPALALTTQHQTMTKTTSKSNKPRTSASQYRNYEKWPAGVDASGRFHVSPNQCWKCFQDGHISRNCTDNNPALSHDNAL